MRRRRFMYGMTLAGAGLATGAMSRRARGAVRSAAPEPRGRPARATTTGGAVMTALLERVPATVAARVTRFDLSSVVESAEVGVTPAGTPVHLRLGDADVTCRLQAAAVPDQPDACDIVAVFRWARERLANASVSLVLTVGHWSRDGYLLIPGAVYGGNRFASRRLAFPPLLSEPSDLGPHVPPIVSDIPRLNNLAGDSRIALRATDMAAPTVGVRVAGAQPGTGVGLLVLAEPTAEPGPTGLVVSENAERTSLALDWSAPGVRPDFRYTLCNTRAPSSDRGADIGRGFIATLRLRLIAFDCPTVQTLFDRAFDVRRARVGAAILRHELPLSAARRLIGDRLVRDTWADAPGLFLPVLPFPPGPPRAPGDDLAPSSAPPPPGMDTQRTEPTPRASVKEQTEAAPPEARFSTGAGGALAVAVPLCALGAADARRRATSILDFQLRGQAASGFLRAASDGLTWWDEGDPPPGNPGRARAGGGAAAAASAGARTGTGMNAGRRPQARNAHPRRWTHVGRHTEALHLGCKLALLLGRTDAAFQAPDGWRTGLGRAADALVRLWNRHQQLGQYVVPDSGDLAVGGSTAGALGPAALLLAARALERPAYQDAAVAIADELHARFARVGLTMGGAPAALQCPDSRTAAQLLESFIALADVTGDSAWVDRAAGVAHQLATWVMAWDAPLPANSALGRMGVRTVGAVLTSVQDKWALPGLVGLSGESLLRLYRATGRVAYLELLRETVHNSTGYVTTARRRPGADTPLGWVASPICIGDAAGAPGDIPAPPPPSSSARASWLMAAEASCLLAATEIPSVYVQPDTGFVFTFDHVDVRITERTLAHVRLSLRNPTAAEAELRILSEHSRDLSRPLDAFPLWGGGGARTVTLAPGATDEIELAVDPAVP